MQPDVTPLGQLDIQHSHTLDAFCQTHLASSSAAVEGQGRTCAWGATLYKGSTKLIIIVNGTTLKLYYMYVVGGGSHLYFSTQVSHPLAMPLRASNDICSLKLKSSEIALQKLNKCVYFISEMLQQDQAVVIPFQVISISCQSCLPTM